MTDDVLGKAGGEYGEYVNAANRLTPLTVGLLPSARFLHHTVSFLLTPVMLPPIRCSSFHAVSICYKAASIQAKHSFYSVFVVEAL